MQVKTRSVRPKSQVKRTSAQSSVSPEEAMMENAANDVSKPKPGLLKSWETSLGVEAGLKHRWWYFDSRELLHSTAKDGEASSVRKEVGCGEEG